MANLFDIISRASGLTSSTKGGQILSTASSFAEKRKKEEEEKKKQLALKVQQSNLPDALKQNVLIGLTPKKEQDKEKKDKTQFMIDYMRKTGTGQNAEEAYRAKLRSDVVKKETELSTYKGISDVEQKMMEKSEEKEKEKWIVDYVKNKRTIIYPSYDVVLRQYPDITKEAEDAYLKKQEKDYQDYLDKETKEAKEWMERTGSDVDAYMKYRKEIIPIEYIVENMQLQNSAVETKLREEKRKGMDVYDKYIDDLYTQLKPVGKIIDVTTTGFTEGLTGLDLNTANILTDPPTLLEKIGSAGGNLAGFFLGLYGVSPLIKEAQIAKFVDKFTKSKKIANTLTSVIKTSTDFTLLGQAHSFIKNESLTEHLKTAGIDTVSGAGYSTMGMLINKLPRIVQPLVEAGIWTGIAKAHGADNEDAIIQGILMGSLKVFGAKPYKTNAEMMRMEANKFLGIKEGTTIKEIEKVFKEKTKGIKVNSLEYQKYDAARIISSYPKELNSLFKESRLIGYKGFEKKPETIKNKPLEEIKETINKKYEELQEKEAQLEGLKQTLFPFSTKTTSVGNIKSLGDIQLFQQIKRVMSLKKYTSGDVDTLIKNLPKDSRGQTIVEKAIERYREATKEMDYSGIQQRGAMTDNEILEAIRNLPTKKDIAKLQTQITFGTREFNKIYKEMLKQEEGIMTKEELEKDINWYKKEIESRKVRDITKIEKDGLVIRLPDKPVRQLTDREKEILKSKEVNPLQRSLGEASAEKFEVGFKLNEATRAIKKILTKKEFNDKAILEALTSYIADGTPLPSVLEGRIKEIKEAYVNAQKFAYEYLINSEIVESLWTAENYVRRIVVQKDGKPMTPAQAVQLEIASNKIKGDLLRVSTGATQYGLKIKSKFYQERKFKTLDEADTYLDKFGLKIDRNLLTVFTRQFMELSDIAYNYRLSKSLREQAKLGVKGLKEVYDPKEYGEKIEEYLNKYKDLKLDIIYKYKKDKKLFKEDSKILKKKIELETKEIKKTWRSIFKRKDIAEALDTITKEFESFKNRINKDVRMRKGKAYMELRKGMNILKENFAKFVNDSKIEIKEKYKKALKDDYVKPHDMIVAQQLRGVMFDKKLAQSFKHIMEKPPSLSSPEDFYIFIKTMQLTLDVFKIKELIFTSWGMGKTTSPMKIMKYMQSPEYLKDAKLMLKGGVEVEAPIDINLDILKKFTDKKEIKEDSSGFTKAVETIVGGIEKTKAGKIAMDIIRLPLGLEKLQWDILLKGYKVKIGAELYRKMIKKNPKANKDDLLFRAGSFTNDAFQGQNWKQIMAKNPKITTLLPRVLRMIFLGPDKFASFIKLPLHVFKKGERALGARMFTSLFVREIILETAITQLLNYMFTGHSTLENTRGNEFSVEVPQLTDEEGNPQSFTVYGGGSFELIKMLNRQVGWFKNKLSGVIGAGADFLFPTYGEPDMKQIASNLMPLPINLQDLGSYIIGQLWDSNGIPKYGVPSGLLEALASFGLEFSGLPVTYRTGEGKASMIDVLRGAAYFEEAVLDKKPSFVGYTKEQRENKEDIDALAKIQNEGKTKVELEAEIILEELNALQENGNKDELEKRRLNLKKTDKELYDKVMAMKEDQNLGLTPDEIALKNKLQVENGARAYYIFNKLQDVKDKEGAKKANEQWADWKKKKIITDEVSKQFKMLMKMKEEGKTITEDFLTSELLQKSKKANYGKGNINLNDRPIIKNKDGSISTVRSISIDEDGKTILIPTVRKGLDRIMTDWEAIDWYEKTGEYLGKFNSIKEADTYAEQLHQSQQKMYAK